MSRTRNPTSKELEYLNERLRPVFDIFRRSSEETDIGCAIILCGILEDLLEELLLKRIVTNGDTIEYVKRLSLFNRISFCLAVGVIDEEEARRCRAIARVRNEFAHNVRSKFSSPHIVDLVKKLNVPIGDMLDMVGEEGRPKANFAFSCFMILIALALRMFSIGSIQKKNWTKIASVRVVDPAEILASSNRQL